MKKLIFRLANLIYRATPWQPVRQLYFDSYARLVRNRRVQTTIDDIALDLDLGEAIDLAVYLQQYEPDVREGMLRITRPGMTVFDIGANVGAHALVFAKLVGREGKVFAFEPTAYAFEKLQKNAALNPALNVELVHIALSDKPEPPREVNFRASWRTDGSRADGMSMVEFQTLDTWSRMRGIDRLDVIKIDVDGNEYVVFNGARETIARFRPTFLMEVAGLHFDDENRNPFAILEGLGYRFFHLKERRDVTLDELRSRLPKNDPGMSISMNILASPGPQHSS